MKGFIGYELAENSNSIIIMSYFIQNAELYAYIITRILKA